MLSFKGALRYLCWDSEECSLPVTWTAICYLNGDCQIVNVTCHQFICTSWTLGSCHMEEEEKWEKSRKNALLGGRIHFSGNAAVFLIAIDIKALVWGGLVCCRALKKADSPLQLRCWQWLLSLSAFLVSSQLVTQWCCSMPPLVCGHCNYAWGMLSPMGTGSCLPALNSMGSEELAIHMCTASDKGKERWQLYRDTLLRVQQISIPPADVEQERLATIMAVRGLVA